MDHSQQDVAPDLLYAEVSFVCMIEKYLLEAKQMTPSQTNNVERLLLVMLA
jgi:hypothetical protein